jgi:tetratricopeptide (TPR) repeat protein
MNLISKLTRILLILNLASIVIPKVALAADNAPNVTPTGRAEETNSADMLRAYLQLQEQVHATQLAIERNRQEADEIAARAAEGLNGRLKAIEESLATQRNGDLQAMQNSNHLMILLAGMFAAIALVAMLVMAVFQWRTVNRLAEISATASAGGFAFSSGRPVAVLGPGDSHSVTVAPAEHSSGPAPLSTGLLNAVERLEKRVNELEHTAHPPLHEGAGGTNPAATEHNDHSESNHSEAKSVPENLASTVIGDERKNDAPSNGAAHESAKTNVSANGPSEEDSEHSSTISAEAAPATEAGRITGLLGKGQSLLNVDKAEEALACFDEVLMLDARNAEALVKKGTALERLRKLDEAIDCYDRAIAADSSMTIAYLYKGGLFNRLERFSEAMQCYEQALRTQEKGRA